MLLTLFNTCTGFKKGNHPPEISGSVHPEADFTANALNNGGNEENGLTACDMIGLYAKSSIGISQVYILLLFTLLKNKHHLSLWLSFIKCLNSNSIKEATTSSVASGKVKINRVNEIIKDAADIITMIQYFRQKHFTLASVSMLLAYQTQ